LIPPYEKVFEALKAKGCAPTGDPRKGTARCPAHEDRSPSLSFCVGADDRAVVHCHAGCRPEAVVAALGFQMTDLFPDGHRNAGPRRARPKLAETGDPLVEILTALGVIGIAWRATQSPSMFIAETCPACGVTGPGALWITRGEIAMSPRLKVAVTCFSGCSAPEILAGLERLLSARTSAEARIAREQVPARLRAA